MSWKSHILLVLILLPLMLILALPARLAHHLIAPDFGPLALYEIDGVWWNGQAEVMLGDRHLGQWRWYWAPLALFSGDLALDGDLEGERVSGSARLIPSLDGPGLHLQQVQLKALAQALDFNEDLSRNEPGGRLIVMLDTLQVGPQASPVAIGQIDWHSASLANPGLANPRPINLAEGLGTIRLVFSDREVLGGNFRADGPATLTGSFKWAANQIQVSGQLSTQAEAAGQSIPTGWQDSLVDALMHSGTGDFGFAIHFDAWPEAARAARP